MTHIQGSYSCPVLDACETLGYAECSLEDFMSFSRHEEGIRVYPAAGGLWMSPRYGKGTYLDVICFCGRPASASCSNVEEALQCDLLLQKAILLSEGTRKASRCALSLRDASVFRLGCKGVL